MKDWIMYTILVVIVVVSLWCSYQVFVLGDNPAEDARLYKEASKINPSCADWCADLQWEDDGDKVSKACLKRTIERGYCRR